MGDMNHSVHSLPPLKTGSVWMFIGILAFLATGVAGITALAGYLVPAALFVVAGSALVMVAALGLGLRRTIRSARS